MKFSCTQENLKTALTLIGHIAARQGSLPILSNVLIRAQDRILTLVTTNLEVGMTFLLRGKVEEDGAFTTNARLLTDVVALLPKSRVDATVVGAELELRCGGHGTKVRGMDAAEFPLIPTVARNQEAFIDGAVLREALGQTAFAVASGESRPELGGVLCTFREGTLTIAATDSYRLAERSIPLTESTVAPGTAIIIPGRTVTELLRILGIEQDGAVVSARVGIAVTPSQVLCTVGSLEVISRLVEGTYPDYTQILPRSWTSRMIIPRGDLQTAARAASLFARTGINDVHLRCLPKERQCIVRSENAQIGEHQAILEADVEGEAMTTILNARYLLEGLAAIPGERIAIEMTGGAAPVVLRPAEGEGYLYVIMPIKQ